MLRDHEHLVELQRRVDKALRRHHLVQVAAALAKQGAGESDLADLGIATDLLDCFPAWRRGSRAGFRPKDSGLRPVPTGAGLPLGAIRLQLSASSITVPLALTVLRDLLAAADPQTRIVVVVEPGAARGVLEQLLGTLSGGGSAGTGERVQFVEMRTASLFAQDNARAAVDAHGDGVLVLPRAFGISGHRAEDRMDDQEAERAFGVRVLRSKLHWEGGNLLTDGKTAFVGVDTLAENRVRLGLTSDELLACLRAEMGVPVVPLGELSRAAFDMDSGTMKTSGQASFHIDMDISLLGKWGRLRRPRALVADPAAGLEVLSSVLAKRSLFAHHFLPARKARDYVEAEYEGHAEERHPRLLAYAAALEEARYRVFGVPDLRVDPEHDVFTSANLHFSYCNVLAGLHRGVPSVHFMPWGIPGLDTAARASYAAAGLESVAISNPTISNGVMRLFGGLHCVCGQLPLPA